MVNQFSLQIITPKGLYINKMVESITILTDNGEITILPNHIEYLANVNISILKIFGNAINQYYAVGGGATHFYEKENVCRLLLRSIYSINEIDIELTKKAQLEALDKLKKSLSNVEHAHAEMALKRAINKLNLKNNYNNK